ncbi:hypothetical protein OSB04_016823 [Centaurea solstitialis]|uniref:Mitochondrial protein n=1 Tax=Centaurea solstitialis TaxID=347529 RepID=A0AA38T1Q8_9ASTR|nr:hypothetical protein OSB04_016823 [Centaurea solstitialis]
MYNFGVITLQVRNMIFGTGYEEERSEVRKVPIRCRSRSSIIRRCTVGIMGRLLDAKSDYIRDSHGGAPSEDKGKVKFGLKNLNLELYDSLSRTQVRQRPDGIFINQSNTFMIYSNVLISVIKELSGNHWFLCSISRLVDLISIFSTGVCARFQCDPHELHLSAVKRILRYLKGTPDFGLCTQRILPTQTQIMQVVSEQKKHLRSLSVPGDKLVSSRPANKLCLLINCGARVCSTACCCSPSSMDENPTSRLRIQPCRKIPIQTVTQECDSNHENPSSTFLGRNTTTFAITS